MSKRRQIYWCFNTKSMGSPEPEKATSEQEAALQYAKRKFGTSASMLEHLPVRVDDGLIYVFSWAYPSPSLVKIDDTYVKAKRTFSCNGVSFLAITEIAAVMQYAKLFSHDSGSYHVKVNENEYDILFKNGRPLITDVRRIKEYYYN